MQYHASSIAQVEKEQQTDRKRGLSAAAVKKRRAAGKNALPQAGSQLNAFKIFIRQWKSPLILVLVVAGTISGLLGETIDMTIIYITAFLNALIGFFQEYKADSALQQLASLTVQHAIVIRDGDKQQVLAEELVTGDIVLVSPGQNIPADGRLVAVEGLHVNESALTGESATIEKKTKKVSAHAGIGDQANMLFRGTTVVDGTGTMIVTAIGTETNLGKIAALVSSTEDEETPLQKELAKLAKYLTYIIVAIAVAIFAIGILLPGEESVLHLFEVAIAVAVAAIPEGLVISLTVILAIGMQFILKRNALVRRLVAAETLGGVSVICTDKTGTLTEGKMSVEYIQTYDSTILLKNTAASMVATKALEIGVICNDATIVSEDGSETIVGDTTDIAFVEAGGYHNMTQDALVAGRKKLGALPFSSEWKYMAAAYSNDDGATMYIKGAPDILLNKATAFHDGDDIRNMTDTAQKAIAQELQTCASQGYRTLALAYKKIDSDTTLLDHDDVSDLVWVGFVAIEDPIRDGVKETIKLAKKAGIRIIMITGDHKKTAAFIAKRLGIKATKETIREGSDLEQMSDTELQSYVKKAAIFARVSPEHKIRIVQALKANREVVAMTGDGINDAPALKGADIGVAVGSGTDVAKETADMVLLDDSFTTIVAAVEEGRTIYANIKKVVVYMLSGSFAEVVMVLGSLVAGLPVAALPAQILWVNIIEDSFPTMSLAFEKGSKKDMSKPPRKLGEPLFSKEMKMIILLKSVLSNVMLFAIFYYMLQIADITTTRTVVFAGFAVDSLFLIFSVRQLEQQVWQYNPFSNKKLLGAVLFGWSMLLLAIYAPPLQTLLRTVALGAHEWALLISFGVFNVILIEAIKAVFISKKQYA